MVIVIVYLVMVIVKVLVSRQKTMSSQVRRAYTAPTHIQWSLMRIQKLKFGIVFHSVPYKHGTA